MKKKLVMVLTGAAVCAALMVACQGKGKEPASDNTQIEAVEPETEATPEATEPEAEQEKSEGEESDIKVNTETEELLQETEDSREKTDAE